MLSAKKMLESVNSVDTLTQEELFPLFSRASSLVYDCLRVLVRENSFVQLRIVDLGAEVASNLDRNKAIYRRSVEYVDGTLKDVQADPEERESDFLCACMDMQLALAKQSKSSQLLILNKLPLTRMVFEEFVKSWLKLAEGYQDIYLSSAHAHAVGSAHVIADSDVACMRIEDTCGLDAFTAFGVIRYVHNRVVSLKSIYDRVFNAYSRVILKLAKTQAVSDDHSLDCNQNGSFGLMRAISSYDHISNARFVGHARWWIRQSMLFHLKEDSNVIKVSANTWQAYAKLEGLRSKLESQHGPLDEEELSKHTGYSTSHVETIYGMVRTSQVKSLDYPLKPDGSSSTILSLVDDTSDTDTLTFTASDSVKQLMEDLPPDLRNLVCLNYGLVEYVSQELDPQKVEAERVRQTRTSSTFSVNTESLTLQQVTRGT